MGHRLVQLSGISIPKGHDESYINVDCVEEMWTERGTMLKPSARVFQEVLHRVLAAVGFEEVRDARGRVRRYITFHSLRQTFASHYLMNGGDCIRLPG